MKWCTLHENEPNQIQAKWKKWLTFFFLGKKDNKQTNKQKTPLVGLWDMRDSNWMISLVQICFLGNRMESSLEAEHGNGIPIIMTTRRNILHYHLSGPPKSRCHSCPLPGEAAYQAGTFINQLIFLPLVYWLYRNSPWSHKCGEREREEHVVGIGTMVLWDTYSWNLLGIQELLEPGQVYITSNR